MCNDMNDSKNVKFLMTNSDVSLVKNSFPLPKYKTKIISTYNNFDLFVAGKMSEIMPQPKLSAKQEEKSTAYVKTFFLHQVKESQAHEKFDTFIFQEKLNNQLKSDSNSISMKTKI